MEIIRSFIFNIYLASTKYAATKNNSIQKAPTTFKMIDVKTNLLRNLLDSVFSQPELEKTNFKFMP
jgi:hypothetical protein